MKVRVLKGSCRMIEMLTMFQMLELLEMFQIALANGLGMHKERFAE